jgi:hypothetical protein
MAWLKTENDDLYDPSYTDMLRVAFTSEFKRGRLQDLVALLSGRTLRPGYMKKELQNNRLNNLKRDFSSL